MSKSAALRRELSRGPGLVPHTLYQSLPGWWLEGPQTFPLAWDEANIRTAHGATRQEARAASGSWTVSTNGREENGSKMRTLVPQAQGCACCPWAGRPGGLAPRGSVPAAW